MSPNETGQTQSPRSTFYQSFYQTDLTAVDQKKTISRLDFVYGFDIPALIITFLNTKLDGYLKFKTQSGDVSGLSFFEGQIQHIDVSDAETKIGTLLINSRMITKDLLDKALAEKGELPIGVYLIKKGYVKAEQVGEVLLTQSRMRLSKLISETKYKLSFEENKLQFKTSEVNLDRFNILMHDWIASKFSEAWLLGHYIEYYNSVCKVNWENIKFFEGQNYPLFVSVGIDFFEKVDNGNLSNLAVSFEKNKNFFKALHFLILLNWVELVPSEEDDKVEVKLKHLYKLIINKTDVELLNELSLITKEDPENLETIFELIKSNYLDRSVGHVDMKLEIEKKMMSLLLNHKSILSKLHTNNNKVVPTKVAVDMQPILRLLLAQNYKQALTLAKKNKDQASSTPKLQLYIAWGQIALAYFENVAFSVVQLENDFMLTLPEDVNSAEYHYVYSLLFKIKKQDSQADKSYKTAVQLNSDIRNFPYQKSLFSWFKK